MDAFSWLKHFGAAPGVQNTCLMVGLAFGAHGVCIVIEVVKLCNSDKYFVEDIRQTAH